MDKSLQAFLHNILGSNQDPMSDYQDTLSNFMNAQNRGQDSDFAQVLSSIPQDRLRSMLGEGGSFGNITNEDNVNVKDSRDALNSLIRALSMGR